MIGWLFTLFTNLFLFTAYLIFKSKIDICDFLKKWIEEHKQDYRGNRTGDLTDAYLEKISENADSFSGKLILKNVLINFLNS